MKKEHLVEPDDPFAQFLLELHQQNTDRFDRLTSALWYDRIAIIGLAVAYVGKPVLAAMGIVVP